MFNKSTPPKITIITPSYNQGAYIEETILSIINQEYPNLEYIVIDGGSKDQTVDIIKKYEHKITYWESEKDRGQSHAINKGFARATGDIVTWINSDDLLLPNALSAIASHFDSSSEEVGLIHGGTVLFNSKGSVRNELGTESPNLERYLSGIVFSQPAAFFKKMYLDKVGPVREDLHFGMDYDLFSRLALVCEFKKVDTIFSKYRLHEESKTVKDTEKFIVDWIKVFCLRVRELRLTKVEKELKSLELWEEMDSTSPTISPDVQIDEEKLLFYFICNCIKAYYNSGGLSRALTLRNYLKKRYPAPLINSEYGMEEIVKRLSLPLPFIKLAKQVKSCFLG